MQRLVHRLILEAFVGPCPRGKESCHFPDRNPTNNRLENLRWDTHAANGRDMALHGTAGARRLTVADIIAIRRLRERRIPVAVVADWFGICQGYVWQIASGKRWPHVAMPEDPRPCKEPS